MNQRKKNNILIGVLCCVLVFMGVGYAILSRVLTISSTANITGDFDIRITSITPLPAKTTSGATSVSTSVENDNVTANVEVSFNGPGDYITYLVTVENFGTIDGVISEVETNVNNSQYYTIEALDMTTEQALQTPVDLLVGGNPYQFYVRLTFDKDRLISSQSQLDALKTSLTTTLSVRTAQKRSISNQSQSPVVYVDQEDSCFISFRDGEINYYDTSKQGCGSTVTIPDNLRLKTSTLTGYTFNSQLCLAFAPNLKGAMGYGSLTDEQFCGGLQNTIAQLYNSGQEDLYDEIYSGFVIPTYTEATGDYSVITKVGAGSFVARSISSLTLSSNITEIKEAAFTNNSFTTVTLPNSLTSIGKYAFMFGGLTSVTIPSSLQSIGESAFSRNSITSLNLTNASSLTSIGENAFYNNSLGTLDLSGATSLTAIGNSAFSNAGVSGTLSIPSTVTAIGNSTFSHNRITGTITIPSSVQTIGDSAFYVSLNSEYKLTGLNLSNATSLTTIGNGAFSNQNISTLDLSATTHLETIGNYAFNFNNLTGTLTIPSSVTTIGECAFSDNKLTTVNLSNANSLTSIGINVFAYQRITDNDPLLTSINASNKTKAQYDAISNNQSWYDNNNANFHITYSDYTCDHNDTCIAN